jgi:Zn-dependent protease
MADDGCFGAGRCPWAVQDLNVASTPIELNKICKGCSSQIVPGEPVCRQCHTLVHAEELEKLSVWAKTYDDQNENGKARETWLKMLPLLPTDSTQAKWVQGRLRSLDLAAKSEIAAPPKNQWAKKFGPLAPIAIALSKAKVLLGVFKFKFFFSLFAFLGFYWALFGKRFGIGFAILILIHEMGHYVDLKLRGLPAEMPVFLPGFGAYVKWEAMGVSNVTRAFVSLAGPLAGFISSAACYVIWFKTRDPLWGALARTGAWLNVLNLIPIWVLDGGQAILVLNRIERTVILTVALGMWLLVGEGVFALVAGAACWRLFTKDIPEQPSRATTAYFVAVIVLLALVLHITPGQGPRFR